MPAATHEYGIAGVGEDESDTPSSSSSSSSSSAGAGGGGKHHNLAAASSPAATRGTGASAWYCEARQLFVNLSAIRLGSSDLAIPTSAQKGLWRPRALLLRCSLRWAALKAKNQFGMLMRQLLPGALGEYREKEPSGAGSTSEAAGVAAAVTASDGAALSSPPVVVFVARYSVKNFFLAHYDLLQVATILLHALGPEMAAGNGPKTSAQLVFVPPDKANQDWWGLKPLWQAFSSLPILSFAEWAAEEGRRTPQRSLAKSTAQPSRLVPVRRAIFALSGQHSVYGRGTIGRAIEKVRAPCAVVAAATFPRMRKLSAVYRPFLRVALAIHGLLYLPPPGGGGGGESPSSRVFRGVWISRGKGLGRGYGKTVGRRCLNEDEVLGALHISTVGVHLTPLELAGMPFAEQLPHFRSASVMTGMHGAGYANLIFLPVGSVVAELCPLGYCTQSYQRLSPPRDHVHAMDQPDPREREEGYDTIVDTGQFISLMASAVRHSVQVSQVYREIVERCVERNLSVVTRDAVSSIRIMVDVLQATPHARTAGASNKYVLARYEQCYKACCRIRRQSYRPYCTTTYMDMCI